MRHRRIRLIIVSLMVTTNLWLVSEAPKFKLFRKKLKPQSQGATAGAAAPSGKSLSAFLRDGVALYGPSEDKETPTPNEGLIEKLREVGVKYVTVLTGVDLAKYLEKEVKPLEKFVESQGFKFQVQLICKDVETISKDVEAFVKKMQQNTLVVVMGGCDNLVEVLQKNFSSKFWLASLDSEDKKNLKLRSCPLTKAALSNILQRLKKEPDALLAEKFVSALKEIGVQGLAFDYDYTITRPIPSEWAAPAWWKKRRKEQISDHFMEVVKVLPRYDMWLYVVTFNIVKVPKRRIPNEGDLWVERALEANGIKPRMIVATNPEVNPQLSWDKSFHLKQVREADGLQPRNVLLIDDQERNVRIARQEGYPAFQVVGGNGFDLRNLIAF